MSGISRMETSPWAANLRGCIISLWTCSGLNIGTVGGCHSMLDLWPSNVNILPISFQRVGKRRNAFAEHLNNSC